jgi:ABC-type lipoprotein release transport system permease subunit
MKPLSVIKYFINNQKKFLSVFIAVSLSVFLIYTLQMLITSMSDSVRSSYTEPKKYFSALYSRNELLDRNLFEQIINNKDVEKVIPCFTYSLTLNINIGGSNATPLYVTTLNDNKFLMNKMNLKLVEGSLPQPGTLGIVIHRYLAANKGLKVGDVLTSTSANIDYLPCTFIIVGIIEGKSVVSFGNLNSGQAASYGLIIVPKEGSLKSLNRYLDSLPPSNMYTLSTYDSEKRILDRTINNTFMLTTVMSILILLIVSSCVGFLSYIYFYHRRYELGLLNAMGYSMQQIMSRAFSEIFILNISGFISGILLSFITVFFLNILLFLPGGQPLYLFDFSSALQAFSVPIFAALFSLIPVWRMLRKLDPISIIEGSA